MKGGGIIYFKIPIYFFKIKAIGHDDKVFYTPP